MTLNFTSIAVAAAHPVNEFAKFVLGSEHADITETEKLAREVQTLLFIKEDRMRREPEVLPEEKRKDLYDELMRDPVRLRKEVGADYKDPTFLQEFEKKQHDLSSSSRWKPVPDYSKIFLALYKDRPLIMALRYIQVGVCLRFKLQDEIGREPEDEPVKSPALRVFKNDPDALKKAISRLDDLNDKEKKKVSDGWTLSDTALYEGLKLLRSYPEVAAPLLDGLNTPAPRREKLVVDNRAKEEETTGSTLTY